MARVAPWVFDDFVIDLDSREVRRGGTLVSLSPKAFQLLGILVSNRPKAMSKRELQEHLWPDTFVVEKNLTNLVSEIREALDDDPVHPRFIRTVPRFGYAFVHVSSDSLRDGGPVAGRRGPRRITSRTTCPSHAPASSDARPSWRISSRACRRHGF